MITVFGQEEEKVREIQGGGGGREGGPEIKGVQEQNKSEWSDEIKKGRKEQKKVQRLFSGQTMRWF